MSKRASGGGQVFLSGAQQLHAVTISCQLLNKMRGMTGNERAAAVQEILKHVSEQLKLDACATLFDILLFLLEVQQFNNVTHQFKKRITWCSTDFFFLFLVYFFTAA